MAGKGRGSPHNRRPFFEQGRAEQRDAETENREPAEVGNGGVEMTT